MYNNNVRNALLVILGVLAVIVGVIALFSRSMRIVIPILIAIFALGRIGSRKSEKEKNDTKKTEEYREVRDDEKSSDNTDRKDSGSTQTETETGYKQDMKHVRAISSALFGICNMDVRNLGMNVNRIARDIIKENYEAKNGCRGFGQFEKYYLPTLRTTVENYCSMEKKGIVSQKIRDDMISYLKSCEQAFSRMYSSMFDDDILNMEVQMEAMNIALKRDGLL